jgi:circadian clock protein KaiC
MPTGVPNLDEVLGGGIPLYSFNMVAGPPGTGKTILCQQIVFNHARQSSTAKALYLTTLSEPTLKVIHYLQQFTFFDAEAFGKRVVYQDIGSMVRQHPLHEVTEHIAELVQEHRPEILVIDSIKGIRDLAANAIEFRQFCYDLSLRLATARCTTFLVGEYDREEIVAATEFAVADGIIYLHLTEEEGERRRLLQLYKIRGAAINSNPFVFTIGSDGIRILSPALTIKVKEMEDKGDQERALTGIAGLDALLQGGIPRGRTLLLSGASGTGKTILGLQFLVNGCHQGQRGLLFSFEETSSCLNRLADSFGWNLKRLTKEGLLRIFCIPQTNIRVEENIAQMIQEVQAFKPDRFVVDSFSVFLHRVKEAAAQRDRAYQLATLVQSVNAVGILTSDIPAGDPQRISCFGVEETVLDGAIVLSTELAGLTRRRLLEVYKMRGTNHIRGKHRMEITQRGIDVLYTGEPELAQIKSPPPLVFEPTRGIIGDNLPYGTAWLIRGDAGVGKSTLAYQFTIEALAKKEAVLYIAADTPADEVRHAMHSFGSLVDPYLESGQLVILDLFSRNHAHLDVTDPDAFLFTVAHSIEGMPRPLRFVLDSMTPLVVSLGSEAFVKLVHQMIRTLRRPDVALFYTLLRETLDTSSLYSLVNAFDVVLDLYIPDWGKMSQTGGTGRRVMQVRKARAVSADIRPYPYIISPNEGFAVEKDYYSRIGQRDATHARG